MIDPMTDELVFKEPPPNRQGGGPNRWKQYLPQLKARPGEWACLGPLPRNTAFAGYRSLKYNHGMEAMTRKVGEDLYELYVRYPE